MRIVHVVRQYAPSIGGLEAVVAHLSSEQRHRFGHDVRIVTLDRLFSAPKTTLPRDATIDGIDVRRLPWRGSSRYPICPGVLREIAHADLVHVHGIDFFFDFLAATRWLHRKPMVASTHGGFFHTAFASGAKRIWFKTITRASSSTYRRIIATSDADGVLFSTIAAARTTVVENGADIVRYRDAASRAELPVLIYFGRWSANKGLPRMMATLAALRELDPSWTLIIAGRPYDLLRTDLEALAEAYGVGTAVELHEAPSNEALRELIGRASYFLCLSRHEGFGIAAVEAMSAGLVPLLSDIPPFRKIIEQCGRGVLLATEDARRSALAIFEHRSDTHRGEERRYLIESTKRYEWPLVAQRYEDVYRMALGFPVVPRAFLPS